MPAHRSHGHRYIEPPRYDELPPGLPAHEAVTSAPAPRSKGRFVAGDPATRAAGSKGGRQPRRPKSKALTPGQQRRAEEILRRITDQFAVTIGGGVVDTVGRTLIESAARKTLLAELAFEEGNADENRKLSESARNDLMYCREHVAQIAVAAAGRTTRDGGMPWWNRSVLGGPDDEIVYPTEYPKLRADQEADVDEDGYVLPWPLESRLAFEYAATFPRSAPRGAPRSRRSETFRGRLSASAPGPAAARAPRAAVRVFSVT
jgi:hypothetical protein